MWIIDRYLLRQFVQVFLICWISLTGLFVVFHAFSNLDEFIRFCENHDQPLLRVMGEYYVYRTLAFFDQISPILAMIAAMFTITWIQRHNELTALMAAGLSRRRIVKPVIAAAICVSLVALVSREAVIPSCRGELRETFAISVARARNRCERNTTTRQAFSFVANKPSAPNDAFITRTSCCRSRSIRWGVRSRRSIASTNHPQPIAQADICLKVSLHR